MSAPRLSGTKAAWERCGNTPYYRRPSGPFPTSVYTDPFNWTQISVGSIQANGIAAGSFDVVRLHAPKYDWEAVKSGISGLTSSRQEQLRALTAVHEWAIDLIKAKEATTSFSEIRKLFEAAPKGDQEAVLEAVAALVQPDPVVEIQLQQEGYAIEEQDVLVVLAGSPAHANLSQVRAQYPEPDHVILANAPAEGLEEALAYFGIYEC